MDTKIKVADIPDTGWEFFYSLTPAEAVVRLGDVQGNRLRFATPLRAKFKLERTGNRVLVRGLVTTTLYLACSLCLEEFDAQLSEEVFSAFTASPEEYRDGEVAAEDLIEEYYEGEELDLWPLIQEHLFLGMPIKPLCHEDCQGLCPVCGQNLNKTPCECSSSVGHPGFVKLKQLRNSLPKK
ncbi:MAG: DUF177 domain-containing protein [Deltaproteobacteria bacterium]|nr:DUF177 domain-containing protein [Deltaproteobacteria bacterium]